MSRQGWLERDTIAWLLEPDNPPVRLLALRNLLDRDPEDAECIEAQRAVMTYAPIRASLEAQYPEGYWVKPGPGYSPKYRATIWQIIFLEQMAADGNDPRVRRGCEYVLNHTQAETGGFGASSALRPHAPPSSVYHCLNGNLVRALLGLGWWGDGRLQQAIEWEAQAITGKGGVRYYHSGTSGPGFSCAVNGKEPCAWGAIKALRGLARVPVAQRSALVQEAIQTGVEFLLAHDLAKAAYPAGYGRISSSWFKLGFPSGYVADVLQNLEVLEELGYLADARVHPALEWLWSKRNVRGRWKNEYSYQGKLWADIERQGQESKWVTLRALCVLNAASSDRPMT